MKDDPDARHRAPADGDRRAIDGRRPAHPGSIEDYIADVAHYRRRLGSMKLDQVITSLFGR